MSKGETVADPIETAEEFARQAANEGVRLAGEFQSIPVRQDNAEARRRFSHHPPSSDAVVNAHETARELGLAFALWLVNGIPWSPERDKAMDALDLAVMHTNAAIARHQLRPHTEFDTPQP